MVWITDRYRHAATWAIEHRYVTVGLAVCALILAGFLGLSGVIGSEFLPHLDEGAIWVEVRWRRALVRRQAWTR